LSGRREGGAEEEVVVGRVRSVIRMDDIMRLYNRVNEGEE